MTTHVTPQKPETGQRRNAVLASAAAIIVGSIMPWATVQTVFGSLSVAGTDGDGKITAIGGGVVLFLAFTRKYRAAAVIAALVLAGGVYDVINISDVDGDEFAHVSVGWGLWLMAIAAAAATMLAWMEADSQNRGQSESQSQLPVAGWHPNPTGEGLRYWDGSAWTDHTHVLDAEHPAAGQTL